MRIEDQINARIGIDLGGTKIEIVVLLANGEIAFRHRVDTPPGDYPATLSALSQLISEASQACQLPDKTPIGMGTPGSISLKTGLMINCNSTCLNNQPLLEDLQAATGRSVRIANDANCFTLSEANDGAGKDAECVFGVILGTGVGGGITFNQQINPGVNGISGEWGHNPLNQHLVDKTLKSRNCYCGRADCVESWLSGPAFANSYQELTELDLSAKQIARQLSDNDLEAQQVFNQYTDLLALALSNVINILDPRLIVLGGGMSNIDAIYRELPAKLVPHVFSDQISTQIVKAAHGDSSGVRGAAWLWSIKELTQQNREPS